LANRMTLFDCDPNEALGIEQVSFAFRGCADDEREIHRSGMQYASRCSLR